MHLIEEAFGEGCDLYDDVLQCSRAADKAQLRKAYYRRALKFHPDKNPASSSSSGPSPALKFQAVSLAYQILQNPDQRSDYDQTGHIPSDAEDDEDRGASEQGAAAWKKYFDQIFGKVTASDIDAFSQKYKCSDEERRDVLKEFRSRKGDLVKMLDYVMLSEPRDAERWVEDYILPAMESGEVESKYRSTMNKTLDKLKKKVAKEDAEAAAAEEDEEEDESSEHEDDDEETETETEEEDGSSVENEEIKPSPKKRRRVTPSPSKDKKSSKGGGKGTSKPKKQQQQPRKTGAAATKSSSGGKTKKKATKGGGGDMTDLIAQIRNKNRGGGGAFASLGARYGVSMDDEDPLDDAEFAKAQARVAGNKNNKKRRK